MRIRVRLISEVHQDAKHETPKSFQGSVSSCLQAPRCLLLHRSQSNRQDTVLKSTTKKPRVFYMVDFILFFAVDCYWVRGRRCQAIHVVPFIRAEAIHMEDVVDLEGQREHYSVVYITDDFSDLEWTKLLRT